jgi:glycosyltransferase involved in cell wall biosynthesis
VLPHLPIMLETSRLIAVIPAFNEAPRIERVLRGLPAVVDEAVVVDDASSDGTGDLARRFSSRVHVATHDKNSGVGAAIATGYRWAMTRPGGGRDAFVVLAGDGQMHPDDVARVALPIARGQADYVKGERFSHPDVCAVMPRERWVGGVVLSWLTSQAIGRPIRDSQCGFTALSRDACERLELDRLYPRYGYPNDLLSQLALRDLRIVEVPVRPVYADEQSKLRLRHVPIIAALVARAGLRRWKKEGSEVRRRARER